MTQTLDATRRGILAGGIAGLAAPPVLPREWASWCPPEATE